jgi:hypothetical protein
MLGFQNFLKIWLMLRRVLWMPQSAVTARIAMVVGAVKVAQIVLTAQSAIAAPVARLAAGA